jgi:hypothetical protein
VVVAKEARNERIYSAYFDELENAALREVARANGVSPNSVIRVAVRKMLGLPAVTLTLPESIVALARD